MDCKSVYQGSCCFETWLLTLSGFSLGLLSFFPTLSRIVWEPVIGFQVMDVGKDHEKPLPWFGYILWGSLSANWRFSSQV